MKVFPSPNIFENVQFRIKYIVCQFLFNIRSTYTFFFYLVDRTHEQGATTLAAPQTVKTEPGVGPPKTQPHSMHAKTVGVPKSKVEIRQYYLDGKC